MALAPLPADSVHDINAWAKGQLQIGITNSLHLKFESNPPVLSGLLPNFFCKFGLHAVHRELTQMWDHAVKLCPGLVPWAPTFKKKTFWATPKETCRNFHFFYLFCCAQNWLFFQPRWPPEQRPSFLLPLGPWAPSDQPHVLGTNGLDGTWV